MAMPGTEGSSGARGRKEPGSGVLAWSLGFSFLTYNLDEVPAVSTHPTALMSSEAGGL